VLHSELAGVTTDIDPEAFAFRPTPGARIIHGGLLAQTGLSPAQIAWHAATAAPKLAAPNGHSAYLQAAEPAQDQSPILALA